MVLVGRCHLKSWSGVFLVFSPTWKTAKGAIVLEVAYRGERNFIVDIDPFDYNRSPFRIYFT
jgi:hypothetical protein